MKGVAMIFIVVVAAVAALLAMPGEAVTCQDVQSHMSPCIAYLTRGGDQPSESCCSGVKTLQASLQSQQDRQTVCSCLKAAASSLSVKPDAASNLPSKCGVTISVPISPNVECSTIS